MLVCREEGGGRGAVLPLPTPSTSMTRLLDTALDTPPPPVSDPGLRGPGACLDVAGVWHCRDIAPPTTPPPRPGHTAQVTVSSSSLREPI